MNKNSYFCSLAAVLLICSLVRAESAAEVAKGLAAVIEKNSDAAVFNMAYSKFMQDTTICVDDKVAMQQELLQVVVQSKEAIAQLLASDTDIDRQVLAKGVVQGSLAFYVIVNAAFAVLWGLVSCASKKCSGGHKRVKPNYFFTAALPFARFFKAFWPVQKPIHLLLRQLSGYGVKICFHSKYVQLPTALLLVTVGYLLADASVSNCKKGLNYKNNLENQLEQLAAIETMLVNERISI